MSKNLTTKRTFGIGAIGGFLAASICSLALIAAVNAAPPGPLKFGVYDPEGAFSTDRDVNIEHLFLPWEDVDLESLPQADAYAMARNRAVLVTIEPWTWTRDERNVPEALQRGIASGRYDENMRQICRVLAGFKSRVTVRWAHEMDDVSGQFIWADWNSDTYIKAYRRMIVECRKAAPNVSFMWSPLGRKNLAAYYPGDAFVDVVGLTVFGLQQWDQDKFGRDRTFKEILKPRYDEAEKIGKPIVVAELGYVGDPTYVENWENSVRQAHAEFPALTSVVYFNQKEVHPWPENYGLPDWRVGSQVLN